MTQTLIQPSTLVELLRYRATEQPDGHAYTFLVDGKKETPPLTYSELDRQARAIAAYLQQYQAKGERALLLYPQGLEVVAAFCGCLYAGVIAIPVPPPESGRLKRTLPRLRAIVKDANATFALVTESILSLIEGVKEEFPEFDQMKWITTESIDISLADRWEDPKVDKDALAYLQYTSGSTNVPKGVMLSHFNLMHHCGYLQKACGYEPDSVTLTWMPYFHDYGLVEGITVPLFNGTPCYLMSPFSFIKRPIQWLKNITRFKVTHSQAPNFAYDLCTRRVKASDLAELDLRCWQAAGNAAEPINPKVMEKFVDTFSPYGFSWETFAPAYGLAEYTLLISTKPKGTTPVLVAIDASAYERRKIVEVSPDRTTGVRYLPSCGRRVCETKIAIVDPDTLKRCAPDEVGEIWASDPSVAGGYWQREDATKETFQAYIADTGEGPFLRTGDLGFMLDGELFITGRIKDLIIVRGTNHYPQDIEWSVQHLDPVFRPDYGAAFSIEDGGEEQLVIVQEIERGSGKLDTEKLIADIRQEIAEEHEIMTHSIVLAKSGTVLKTASGKIQRRAIRQNFLDGKINIVDAWSENPELVAKFDRSDAKEE
ncbi:fatty acyl-AMP ligase [Pannus brasiliensis CCIBt3594]|uniref:Fatty acyl-AMP ligase n=1 Tax=Pannus brasiliensis CCIBt3594 TaxID=1427578 RepID=A0AAW9QWH0_9CHRO